MTVTVTRDAGADAAIAQDYEPLKPAVMRTLRGKLAAAHVHVDDADLDGFYNQAWHAMYLKLAAGEAIENRTGLLVSIAHRRALDEHRATHPDRRAEAGELEAHAVEVDLAARLDDHARIGQLMEGMRDRLGARELEAAALCYVHGYTRVEAARALGIKPRRMDKLMDGVSKKVRMLVGDLEGGDWCDSRRSLIAAYALGVLDAGGHRHVLAADHLRDCSACRHRVLAIRGLTAVTPPVPLLAGALAGGGAAGAGPKSRRPRGTSQALVAGVAVALVVAALAAVQVADEPPAPPPRSTTRGPTAPDAPRPESAPLRARPSAQPKPRPAPRRRTEPRPRPAAPVATAVPTAAATPTPAPTVPPAPAPTVTEPPPDPPLRDGWNEFELGPGAGGP